MYFQAQLGYIIPGNFVGWRIRPIPGFKTPTIPQNYTVEGAEEALSELGVSISQSSPFAMPSVRGGEALDSAVLRWRRWGGAPSGFSGMWGNSASREPLFGNSLKRRVLRKNVAQK